MWKRMYNNNIKNAMKTPINKVISGFVLAALATSSGVGLTSCNDYLEEQPKHIVSPDQLGDSEDACDQWVCGVYSKWVNDMFRWSNFPKVLELDTDYVSGPDWCFSSLGAGNFQGDPSAINTMWFGCYSVIARARMAENYISKMTNISEEYRDNAIGEVIFQEAFAYFLLVRAYGAVPIRDTHIIEGGEPDAARQPIDKVYERITTLLERAAGMLYTVDNPNYRKGHVSAGAAAGMLAKVYATMAAYAMPAGTQINVRTGEPFVYIGDQAMHAGLVNMTFSKRAVAGYEGMDSQELYAKAAAWAKDVIDGKYGRHALLDYDRLWTRAAANESEFMFSIQSVSGNEVYTNTIHNYYAGTMASAGSDVIIEGHWVGNTTHWYKLFDHEDYRIVKGVQHRYRYSYQTEKDQGMYYPADEEWTLKATGYDANGQQVAEPVAPFNDGLQYYNNIGSECLAFTTKYSDVSDPSTKYADTNWPFLRYADVLLIYAEALAETNHSDQAVEYLNRVRQRSNAVAASDPGDLVKLRSMILEERAKELACEGDRRWDLLRWGIYIDAMNAIGGRDECNNYKSRTERHLLYPLPQDEINSNKLIDSNNPGWN